MLFAASQIHRNLDSIDPLEFIYIHRLDFTLQKVRNLCYAFSFINTAFPLDFKALCSQVN